MELRHIPAVPTRKIKVDMVLAASKANRAHCCGRAFGSAVFLEVFL